MNLRCRTLGHRLMTVDAREACQAFITCCRNCGHVAGATHPVKTPVHQPQHVGIAEITAEIKRLEGELARGDHRES